MTDTDRTMADLHVGGALLPGLDAVQPVLHVAVALVEAEVGVLERLLGQFRRVGRALAAVDGNLPLFANEDCPAPRAFARIAA